ncbi:MAG: enoyl-CoA hydratase/isomerase family protein [Thermoplasmata archaeon]|nr:MAG: enoyl-CoA hydratase/isomerase family protein [Thermoplasmata archaeon]
MESNNFTSLSLTQTDNKITTVTLNKPEIHNAFNDTLIAELSECFIKLGEDEDTRLIILTGSGKSFCAGADINWMKAMIDYSHEQNISDSQNLAEMFKIIDECPKPVIGRINGSAFGGGVGLVAVCDVAIAAEDAKFSFSEVKLGIIPAVVSPYVIARIGPGHARKLFITGERFDANTALNIGLIHGLVPEAGLDEDVGAVAETILANGPAAMHQVKKLIAKWLDMDSESYREFTVDKIAKLRTSPEGQEGLKAFLEKRKPEWRRS